MSEPFLGEIRLFSGIFTPLDWALCDGDEVPIQQFAALYSLFSSLYGTTNPKLTFALPDLRGRVPMGAGTGPNLTKRNIGEAVGAEAVQLELQNLPRHTHTVLAQQGPGTGSSNGTPSNTEFFGQTQPDRLYQSGGSGNTVTMAPQMVSSAGNDIPHPNMQPYLAVNYIVCLQGQYPQRA